MCIVVNDTCSHINAKQMVIIAKLKSKEREGKFFHIFKMVPPKHCS